MYKGALETCYIFESPGGDLVTGPKQSLHAAAPVKPEPWPEM